MGSVEEIIVTPLARIPVVGGDVLRAMKSDDIGYVNFGESYFSIVHHGAIKAWKRHLLMTLNLVVPMGLVRFVFIDQKNSKRVEDIGVDRYSRITVPPGIWFGFRGMSEENSLILNIADIKHDETEVERKDLAEYSIEWGIKT